MTQRKPDIDAGRKYSIKEAVYLLEICPDSLLKYTRELGIERIRISSREYYYRGSELLRLWEIKRKRL